MKLAFFAAGIMDVFPNIYRFFCFDWVENIYSANICILFVLNQTQLGSSICCEVGKANTSDLILLFGCFFREGGLVCCFGVFLCFFLFSFKQTKNQGVVLNNGRKHLLCSECNFRK